MAISTQICNGTKHVMKVQVGSAPYRSDMATVAAGGKYEIEVDYNATYREYTVGIDAPAAGLLQKAVVVSSDDLCDNKCITIKEEDDGKLNVHKEARHESSGTATSTTAAAALPKPAQKPSWLPAWFSK